ncbi:MAG TPA: cupin domain-containing protein [Longimicrobiales bacterium]|nr:cupin domain-containing protein [Longimicrobiales bacterium]
MFRRLRRRFSRRKPYRVGRGAGGMVDGEVLAAMGVSARTLVREGPLRVTLVGLGPRGELAPHRAVGPIAIHVVSGELDFRVDGERQRLRAGDVLSLAAGVVHDVESYGGARFLLTLVDPGECSRWEHGREDSEEGSCR